MLKLEQIKIQDGADIIVKVLEPIVYPKVGTIIKNDDIVAKEKANVFYLIAEVKSLPKNFDSSKSDVKVGSMVMISRHSFSPIQFPIEGYDAPALASINIQAIFAIIEDEVNVS